MKKALILALSSLLLSACAATSNTAENHETISNREFADDVTLATINPYYPAQAAKKGIEGYVKLSFDVNEQGKPQNIKVIRAFPIGVFEQHAVEALSHRQYKTKKVNGIAVKKTGLSLQLDFDLT